MHRLAMRGLIGSILVVTVLMGCTPRRRVETSTATPVASSGGQQNVAVGAGGMTRETFIYEMRPILMAIMCDPSGYFRQCFAVAEGDCYATAGYAYDGCAAQLSPQIPPMLYGEADGANAGQVLGACTGQAYEQGLMMSGLRYNTPACNDPSRW